MFPSLNNLGFLPLQAPYAAAWTLDQVFGTHWGVGASAGLYNVYIQDS